VRFDDLGLVGRLGLVVLVGLGVLGGRGVHVVGGRTAVDVDGRQRVDVRGGRPEALQPRLVDGFQVRRVGLPNPGVAPASNVRLRRNCTRLTPSSQSAIRNASPSPSVSTSVEYDPPRMRSTTFVSFAQVRRCQTSQSHCVMKSLSTDAGAGRAHRVRAAFPAALGDPDDHLAHVVEAALLGDELVDLLDEQEERLPDVPRLREQVFRHLVHQPVGHVALQEPRDVEDHGNALRQRDVRDCLCVAGADDGVTAVARAQVQHLVLLLEAVVLAVRVDDEEARLVVEQLLDEHARRVRLPGAGLASDEPSAGGGTSVAGSVTSSSVTSSSSPRWTMLRRLLHPRGYMLPVRSRLRQPGRPAATPEPHDARRADPTRLNSCVGESEKMDRTYLRQAVGLVALSTVVLTAAFVGVVALGQGGPPARSTASRSTRSGAAVSRHDAGHARGPRGGRRPDSHLDRRGDGDRVRTARARRRGVIYGARDPGRLGTSLVAYFVAAALVCTGSVYWG